MSKILLDAPHRRPGSLRNTTAVDGGNADIASLHGCNLLGQRRSSYRGANVYPSMA